MQPLCELLETAVGHSERQSEHVVNHVVRHVWGGTLGRQGAWAGVQQSLKASAASGPCERCTQILQGGQGPASSVPTRGPFPLAEMAQQEQVKSLDVLWRTLKTALCWNRRFSREQWERALSGRSRLSFVLVTEAFLFTQ